MLRQYESTVTNKFVKLMKPCLSMCRVLGLLSYEIQNGEIKECRAGRIYCSVVIFMSITGSLFFLYATNVTSLMSRISTWTLQGNFFYTLSNLLLLSNYVLGSSVVKILKSLSLTAAKLPNEKLQNITRKLFFKDLILIFLLMIHTPKIFTGNFATILLKLHLTYLVQSVFYLDFQYINYVYILARCFEYINEELVRLKENVLTEQSHLLRRVYHNQFNPLLFVKLRYLKKWHYELHNIIRKMNSTFSLQIVSSMIITFSELTFGLYFYIYDLRHKKQRTLDQECWYLYYYAVLSYFSFKLLLLTLICQNVSDENRKTYTIINEIMINTDDKIFKEEVRFIQTH